MNTRNQKRLLVTGGSGFVGGHVAARARGRWVVFATHHEHPFAMRGVTPVLLDLGSKNRVRSIINEVKPSVVIHCAAFSDVDDCQKNPEQAFRINTESARVLGEAAEAGECRLIYVSSDMVFDGNRGDYKESDPTHPINTYGESKLAGEEEARRSCSDAVVARTALVYGKVINGDNSFSDKIIQRVRRGETVPLFHDQIRTPILVQNLADALLEFADIDFKGLVHLGGAEKTDRYTFGVRLAELKKLPVEKLVSVSMNEATLSTPRPRDVSFDVSKARSILKTTLLGYRDGLVRS